MRPDATIHRSVLVVITPELRASILNEMPAHLQLPKLMLLLLGPSAAKRLFLCFTSLQPWQKGIAQERTYALVQVYVTQLQSGLAVVGCLLPLVFIAHRRSTVGQSRDQQRPILTQDTHGNARVRLEQTEHGNLKTLTGSNLSSDQTAAAAALKEIDKYVTSVVRLACCLDVLKLFRNAAACKCKRPQHVQVQETHLQMLSMSAEELNTVCMPMAGQGTSPLNPRP
jgi:hypothetical protein